MSWNPTYKCCQVPVAYESGHQSSNRQNFKETHLTYNRTRFSFSISQYDFQPVPALESTESLRGAHCALGCVKTVTKRCSLENQTFGNEEILLKIVQGEYFFHKAESRRTQICLGDLLSWFLSL